MLSPLTILAEANPIDHVLPQTVFRIGSVDVSNHLFMGTLAAILVLITFAWLARRITPRPGDLESHVAKGRFTQLMETMCVFVREEVARPNLKDITDKYIYYLWTVFFFILFCNLLGLLPIGPIAVIVGSILGVEHAGHLGHWGGTATGNLSLNLPLALVAFLMINIIGVRESGLSYFKHFCPIEITNIGMIPLAILLVFLEVLGLVIKSTVLAMRLFGTMMAGHLVLAVFVSLIPAAGALMYGIGASVVLGGGALLILELFIAMLQAFIFTFLTAIFIAAGAVHEHEHSGHEHGQLHPDGDQHYNALPPEAVIAE